MNLLQRLGELVKEWTLTAAGWEARGNTEAATLARRCMRELSEAVTAWQSANWQWLCGDLIEVPGGLHCAMGKLLSQWQDEVAKSDDSEVRATVAAAAEHLFEVVAGWMKEFQSRHEAATAAGGKEGA